MANELSIYIHIPFCASKCYYCDFNSYPNMDELIEEYINALCEEILNNSDILSKYTIKSIYIGGGTPSYINEKYIKQILDTINFFINKAENLENYIETTIELNPNSVTLDKIIEYKKSGVNRVSVGLQSTYDSVLKTIGRTHNLADFENTLNILKEVGIENISIDLIYPLPNLTLEMFEKSLDYILNIKDKFNIKHISIYNLEIHENTKLAFLLNEEYIKLVDEEEEYKMKELIDSKLKENKLVKYEISNYSLSGFESKHNINYWKQGIYLGFGAGASSFFVGTRYKNIENIEKYINAVKGNISIVSQSEELDKLGLMKEYVILNLRFVEGLDINLFKKKFNVDIFELFNVELSKLKEQNLIVITDKNIKLSRRGSEVANIVWQEFV